MAWSRSVGGWLGVGACLCAAVRAAPAEPAWQKIPKWYLTYSVRIEGQGTQRRGDTTTCWQVRRYYAGRYTVAYPLANLRPPRPGPEPGVGRTVGWLPTPAEMPRPESYLSPMTVVVSDSSREHLVDDAIEGVNLVGPEITDKQTTWRARTAVLSRAEVGLYLDLANHTYAVAVPYSVSAGGTENHLLRETGSTTVSGGGHPTQVRPSPPQDLSLSWPASPAGWAHGRCYLVRDQPLPAEGTSLAGSQTLLSRLDGHGPGDAVNVTVSWLCSPDPPSGEQLLLAAVAPDEYRAWRPRACVEPVAARTKPGNSLELRARLVGPDGVSSPKLRARSIHIQLGDVSHEPGYCINSFGADGAGDHEADLSIEEVTNEYEGGAHDALSGQRATIGAYDFGAWGEVRAYAELTTGEVVVAHLVGQPEEERFLLPWREPGSHVATQWRAEPAADAGAGRGLVGRLRAGRGPLRGGRVGQLAVPAGLHAERGLDADRWERGPTGLVPQRRADRRLGAGRVSRRGGARRQHQHGARRSPRSLHGGRPRAGRRGPRHTGPGDRASPGALAGARGAAA